MDLLVTVLALAASHAYIGWVCWDTRGDVEERRRWENRTTREAADRILAQMEATPSPEDSTDG